MGKKKKKKNKKKKKKKNANKASQRVVTKADKQHQDQICNKTSGLSRFISDTFLPALLFTARNCYIWILNNVMNSVGLPIYLYLLILSLS